MVAGHWNILKTRDSLPAGRQVIGLLPTCRQAGLMVIVLLVVGLKSIYEVMFLKSKKYNNY